jgi:hypothetical protein
MAMNFGQTSVTTSAVAICSLNANRTSIKIRVDGADAYLGASGVTAATGFLVQNGKSFLLEAPTFTGIVYAITASGTATVYISEGA